MMYLSNKEKSIFKAWINKAGSKALGDSIHVAKQYDTENATITYTISTLRPGLMIGYHGSLVEEYKNRLSESMKRDVVIKFIESDAIFVPGGFTYD